MPKKNPPARAVGRRRAPAPASETTPPIKNKKAASNAAIETSDDDLARLDAELPSASPREPKVAGEDDGDTKRSPAEIAAAILLKWAMAVQAITLEDVARPGVITVVTVPTSEWVSSTCDAWISSVSGKDGTTCLRNHHGSYARRSAETVIIANDRPPGKYDRENEDETVAEAMWRGQGLVGISSKTEWLPPDLVTAADYRLHMNALHPGGLRELVHRLTGDKPRFDLEEAETAAAGPRMLRLASRPAQTADQYLTRLRDLVGAAHAPLPTARSKDNPPRLTRAGMTLDRLSGMEEAVAWGQALHQDLVAFREGRRAWADVDKGLLLSGPPGCGKTLFAQALATTCDVPLIEGSYSSWLANGTGHQGDLLIAMKKTFAAAREAAPCILFLDEVDSFPNRSTLKTNHREWIIEVVNALLAELDGVQGREGVVVVGACNNPQFLDPALVRSGRLDRHVRIALPDRKALASIMREHLGGELAGVDLDGAALLATGSTGADVERLVRGARRRARNLGRPVELADLVAEIGGRDDRTADERMRCAIHEAGHAVVSVEVGQPIAVISIRASDTEGGFLKRGRRGFFTTSHGIYDETVCLLAGRAAEEVVFGEATSGAGGSAGSDLALATWLTMRAASDLGLDEEHGLVWEGMPERHADLRAALSGDPALAARVRGKLAFAYRDAVAIVARQKTEVGAVAAALLARGVLDHGDVARIISDVRQGGRP